MAVGDKLKILTYDNNYIIGTVLKTAVDHIIIDGHGWLEKYYIKEIETI